MLSNSDIENYKKIVAQFNRAQADEQAMQAQLAVIKKQAQEILQKYDYVELHKLLDICNDEELSLLNKGVFRQKIVYKIFNRLWKKDNDWMAFIDVDEYIRFDDDYNLEKLCNEFNDKGGFYLKWKMYGAN